MQFPFVTSSIIHTANIEIEQYVKWSLTKDLKKKEEITLNRQLQNVTRSLTGSGRFREVPTVTL